MRFAGALALVVVLVAVVETRPPREKRGIKICSARDVKFMATFVCNLHKRSVRSVDAEDFDLPDTNDLPLLGVASHIPRRTICNENDDDCVHQIEGMDLRPSQYNYLQEWLNENGFIAPVSTYRSLPRMIENVNDPDNQGIENENRMAQLNRLLATLLLPMGGRNIIKGNVAKRDRELNWPLVPSMTLGDIRKNCCIRQCRVEDFYGACS